MMGWQVDRPASVITSLVLTYIAELKRFKCYIRDSLKHGFN